MCICVCVFVRHVLLCAFLCMSAVCMFVSACVYVYVFDCEHVCEYMSVYLCVCSCMHVCT